MEAEAGDGPVRFRAPSAGVLRIVPLDELTAIYDRASGQTHLVAPPVPEILAALAQAPASLEELLARLAACYDLADPDAEALGARVAELVGLGLVQRG